MASATLRCQLYEKDMADGGTTKVLNSMEVTMPKEPEEPRSA